MKPLDRKTQLDYCFVRRYQGKFLKDVKMLPSEECFIQPDQSVCDFKMRKNGHPKH